MVTVEVTGTRMLMGQMTGTVEGDGGSDRGADGGNDGARTMNCGMDGQDSDYSHHLSEKRCTGKYYQAHRGYSAPVYEKPVFEFKNVDSPNLSEEMHINEVVIIIGSDNYLPSK